MTSYVGLDVSLAETSVCVLGSDGQVRFEGKVRSRPEDLVDCVRKHAGDAAARSAPSCPQRSTSG